MTNKPTAWLEVIDPVTGLKVDVRVSFHASFGQAGMVDNRASVADDVNRIAQAVGALLTAEEGHEHDPFEGSDFEEAS